MDAEVINRLKKQELDDLLAKITKRKDDLSKKIPLTFFNLEKLILTPFHPLFKNQAWSNDNGTVLYQGNKITFKGEGLSSQEAFDLIGFMSVTCINFNITKLYYNIGSKNIKMKKPLSKEEMNKAFSATGTHTTYELSNYVYREGLKSLEESLDIECVFVHEAVQLEDVLEPLDYSHYMELINLFGTDITSKLDNRDNSTIIDRYLSKHKGYTYSHLFPVIGNIYFKRLYKLEIVPIKCIDLEVTFSYDSEEDYDRACLDLFSVKQYNIGESEIIDRIPDFFEELKLHADEVKDGTIPTPKTEDINACEYDCDYEEEGLIEESLDSYCF